MSKFDKEQLLYSQAMERALKIAKEQGVDELEREVRYRQSNSLPCNVSPAELTAVARVRAREELMFVATAMATTLSDYLKLPPSTLKDYLHEFNRLIEIYRVDRDRFKTDEKHLNRDYAMNQMCKEYLQEGD